MRSARNTTGLKFWVIIAVIAGLLAVTASPLMAQDGRSLVWNSWDVTIDQVDVTQNRMHVSEQYDVTFFGTFRFGSAYIPLDHVEQITNIRVSQNGRPLQSSCSGVAGTYCVGQDGNNLTITYYFTAPITNGSSSFEIAYDVIGGIRVYEGGDQIWWTAVPTEHYGFSITSSTIQLRLPDGYGPREGVDPVETYGVPADVSVNGPIVKAVAQQPITGNEGFGIRAQFPHNPNARVPAWQDSADAQAQYNETVRPLLSLGLGVVSLLILVVGVLLVWTRYLRHGVDPNPGPVPEFLAEPPSDLPPAIVGTLIDEQADMRDVMSTLIDLARRGYLVIEERKETSGLFQIEQSVFDYKRTDKPAADLRDFERTMLDKIFTGGADTRTLDSLRTSFYTAIPVMQGQLYRSLVTEGFFAVAPNSTRQRWGALGTFILILAVFSFIAAASFAQDYAEGLICLPPALLGVGLMIMLTARAMPAKTRTGSEAAAKWKAFETYLRNLQKYQGVESAAAQFDRFLPYAVAFGIDKAWMRQITSQPQVIVPVPTWYFPTYLGGPWGRGYIPGTPVPNFGGGVPGELARAGGPGGLEGMSQGLSAGLQSMSNGLSTMLNSASSAMSSGPKSSSSGSWSSGGGGFSGGFGGGFSGGGGGGGRGFG